MRKIENFQTTKKSVGHGILTYETQNTLKRNTENGKFKKNFSGNNKTDNT